MRELNPIALAVPVFFLSIGVEALVARRRGLRVYRFIDAVSDLSCGIQQQLVAVFLAAVLLSGYGWLYEHHRLITFAPSSPWPWVIAFIGIDFVYYWWHRASHRVALMWAAHVVHHSSEDFNLAVALRQSIATSCTFFPFWLPLALLGVPPLVVGINLAISLLYQFWIHTELIGKLGPLEWVLNTPSHHRVHHGINRRYLDTNYGAILIVWDRLFGTCVVEDEPVVYGIRHPLGSFEPLRAQLAELRALIARTLRAPSWREKLLHWWMPPGWPEGPPPGDVDRATYVKHDVAVAPGTVAYVSVQAPFAITATLMLMQWKAHFSTAFKLGLSAAVLVSLTAWVGLLEGRRWARPLEVGRLAALGGAGLLVLLR